MKKRVTQLAAATDVPLFRVVGERGGERRGISVRFAF